MVGSPVGAADAVAPPPAAEAPRAGTDAGPEVRLEVVVVATRHATSTLDVPASVDRIEGSALREGFGVNLSDSMGPVPGISVQNRQNFAQDLQLSIRGFGARSSFGARGIRLFADGIPATMPDGQGQYSHFDLSGADRIEVLRGPFSALYGNASGGVIAIYTADAPAEGIVGATAEAGSFSAQRYALRGGGEAGRANYVLDAAHFSTDGYRDHSHAERNTANAKLRLDLGATTRLTLVGNAIGTPPIDDPLGLTATQLAANPQQAGTNAVTYNTRKILNQEQAGASIETELSDADLLSATAYVGHRHTTQFQAILQSVQLASPTHPGGVIDLGRDYRGGELRLTDRRSAGGMPLEITGGISYDVLEEARRGYFNFDATNVGVQGDLRRDDGNHVRSLDEYLQVEWAPTTLWRVVAGLRHSAVQVVSRNHLLAAPPTSIDYSATNPVAGLTFRAAPHLSLYASYGRGFETPTLNDLAYRSTNGSLPGLNTSLLPARSDNYEVGAKFMRGATRATLAAFYIRTENELAVLANSGGRSVLKNIGPTDRRGAELGLGTALGDRFSASLAYTYLDAKTLEPYVTCPVTPCNPSLPASVTVAAGSKLPAVPQNAIYASMTWKAAAERFSATAEIAGRSRIYADDRNVTAAAGYWSSNLRATFVQQGARWKLTETLRLDNVFDRRYVGTVIVNETNGRYFEPSPGRTAYLIVYAAHR
jgi:iron complex outermembrane receptor protein